jgi:hypothetical protein
VVRPTLPVYRYVACVYDRTTVVPKHIQISAYQVRTGTVSNVSRGWLQVLGGRPKTLRYLVQYVCSSLFTELRVHTACTRSIVCVMPIVPPELLPSFTRPAQTQINYRDNKNKVLIPVPVSTVIAPSYRLRQLISCIRHMMTLLNMNIRSDK